MLTRLANGSIFVAEYFMRNLVFALLLSIPAACQTRVTAVTNFPKDAKVTAECQTEVQAFTAAYAKLPQPPAWTFYVVCDESSWSSLMWRFSKTGPAQQYGVTDRTAHFTAIRGWKLTHPDFGVPPDFIVAHEMAHIVLNTSDESKANKQAAAWLGR